MLPTDFKVQIAKGKLQNYRTGFLAVTDFEKILMSSSASFRSAWRYSARFGKDLADSLSQYSVSLSSFRTICILWIKSARLSAPHASS
jgi:hypothetical protein